MRGLPVTLLSAAALVALSATACKPSRPARGAPAAGVVPHPAATSVPPHCKDLRDHLCARFGAGSDECRLAEEQTATFAAQGGDARCAAMLSHGDALATSAARLVEGRRTIASPRQSTLHGPAPGLGSPGAPVTMVLFGDFASPDCARGSGIATTIAQLYRDKVRLVFRQFPLAANQGSHLAAQASLAAHAQGKFWRYYELLFGNQHDLSRAALERYAREAGLDPVAFDQALARREFAGDVDADRQLGKTLEVAVLPALFVNGRPVRFPYGVAELDEVVDRALARRD